MGQYTGCYKAAGYNLAVQADSTAPDLIAAMQRGSVDIGIPGTDQYLDMIQSIKKGGGGFDLKAIYEVAYPFHWGLAVSPKSSITSFQQLAGKTVGVDSLADSSVRILQGLLTNDGINPSKVKIIATGLGAASGQALQSGRVDALFTFDTVFATILQSGIQLRFVLNNGSQPFLPVTGVVAVMPQKLHQLQLWHPQGIRQVHGGRQPVCGHQPGCRRLHPAQAVPVAGSPGKPLSAQIETIAFQVALRARTIESTDPSVAPGAMSTQEFQQTLKYLLGQSPTSMGDVSQYFTDSFTAELTAAEEASTKKSAQDFKIPGLSSPVTIPPIPANAP